MEKVSRRSLLIGASSAGLSAISFGLFVNTSKGGTPNQTPWTNATVSTGEEWTNLGNIASHGPYVTLKEEIRRFGETGYLRSKEYHFNIPGNATIDGIQTRYDAGADGDQSQVFNPIREVRELEIRLVKPTAWSASKTPAFPGNALWSCTGTDGDCNFCLNPLNYAGGSGDVWFNDGLTPGDVNSDDFGFAISAENYGSGSRCAWVDVMMIKVYYTTP